MVKIDRVIGASAERVFAVLADGWSYASWVVGAAHIRDVDEAWPAVGARIHHRIGPWPVQLNDSTVVRAMVPDRMLEINARMWPLGAAQVRLELEPLSADRTRVRMLEALVAGPARLLPHAVQAALLKPRNAEALHRLDDIAVHRPVPR